MGRIMKAILTGMVMALMAVSCASCNNQQPAPPVADPTPVVEPAVEPEDAVPVSVAEDEGDAEVAIDVDWAHKAEASQWSDFTLKAISEIGADLPVTVPSDIADFCPAYASRSLEERPAFWVGLLSAMARFESNFDPTVSFNELEACPSCSWATTSDGRPVISRGLLQLSQESVNQSAYRGCDVAPDEESRLHDPEFNLRCGVAVANFLVRRHGVISQNDGGWKGAAAYWSVLRRPDKLERIQAFTRSTSICQLAR